MNKNGLVKGQGNAEVGLLLAMISATPSLIKVVKETMEEMIENAYTVRDRYTILTLMHDLGLSEKVKPMILERFF